MTTSTATALVLRRTFNAPCERVFSAWLSSDAMRAFMGGDRHKILDVEVDPRVGGSYRIAWDTSDGPITVTGVYRDIIPNERIVCTWTFEEDEPAQLCESLLTLEFRSLGLKTEVVLTHTNLRDEASRDSHASGWASIFDKLEQVLEHGQ
jgi:uncharacterized protein YndB with AHSA1/START domain